MRDALELIGLLALLGALVFASHHVPVLLARWLRRWIREGDESQSSNATPATLPFAATEEEEEPGSLQRTANVVIAVAEAVGALFALSIATILLAVLVYERFLRHGAAYSALMAGQKDATPSMAVLALVFLLMGLRLARRLAHLRRLPGPLTRTVLGISSGGACALWAAVILGAVGLSYLFHLRL